jgi:hypothetical protein
VSDEPTPELRALAARLFAAGRAERAAPALGRRLMLIEPPPAVPPAASAARNPPPIVEGDRAAESTRRERPPRLAIWFAAAGLLALGVSSWLALEHEVAPPTISAERVPGTGAAALERWPREPGDDTARRQESRVVGAFVAEPRDESQARAEEHREMSGAVARGKRSASRPAPAPSSSPRAPAPQAVVTATAGSARAAQTSALERGSPGGASETGALGLTTRTPASGSAVTTKHAPGTGDAPALELTTRAPAPNSGNSAPTLLAELQLLERARAALRSGNAAQALELLERHATTFSGSPAARLLPDSRAPQPASGSEARAPQPASDSEARPTVAPTASVPRAAPPAREGVARGLATEAAVLRIETYAALGRQREASELAERFVRDNPNSAFGDRVKSFIRSARPASRERRP